MAETEPWPCGHSYRFPDRSCDFCQVHAVVKIDKAELQRLMNRTMAERVTDTARRFEDALVDDDAKTVTLELTLREELLIFSLLLDVAEEVHRLKNVGAFVGLRDDRLPDGPLKTLIKKLEEQTESQYPFSVM